MPPILLMEASMGYEMIELTKDGGVATIKLDRPKALNALCGPMMAEVADALVALETDDAIGCVILTGSEKAFAAGADINCLLYTSPSPRD